MIGNGPHMRSHGLFKCLIDIATGLHVHPDTIQPLTEMKVRGVKSFAIAESV